MLDALEASTRADPAVLVHHAVGAHDPDRILKHATDAGRAAARAGAHTQAAEFFRIALDEGALVAPAEQAALLELLADEYYITDRLPDAITSSERALRLRERDRNQEGVSVNHQLLSIYHWYDASRDNAERHANSAVAALADRADESEAAAPLAHAIATVAYLALQRNDLERARALANRAAQVVGEHDPKLALRTAIIHGICDVHDTGAPARDATLAMLDLSGDDLDEVYSSGYSNLTYLDVEQRRLDQANELLGRSIPLTVERDLPICRVWQIGQRGRLKLIEGEWDEARRDADTVLQSPSAPLARTWPHLVRALVEMRRGGDASADLDDAWSLAHRLAEPLRLLPAAAAIVERSWLTGVPDDRLDRCRQLLDDAPKAGLEWTRGELACRLRRIDPNVTADDVAEPYALELAGRFEEAATKWAELGAPYEQALALLDSGRPELRRTGLDLLDRLGADAVAAWFRQDLRNKGVTNVPARRRGTTRANAAGLTTREIEVLGLLGHGLTNAELARKLFISAKTVDHHVSAILAKLGVANRSEAVQAARRTSLID
jgi:DNA-binding CsgD family transcriptional regulator